MNRNKKYIRVPRTSARVLLSEVLPYETPLFFSNRFFKRIVDHYDIRVDGEKLTAHSHTDDNGLSEFLSLLSGNPKQERMSFRYKISKTDRLSGRELTIPHPFRQMQIMELYSQYDALMIDFCHRSSFTLRRPDKTATFWKTAESISDVISDEAKEPGERDNQKHYFHYTRFNNIGRFYDSPLFVNAEQDFPVMCKVDIEKCFETISPDKLPLLMYGDSATMADIVSNPDANLARRLAALQAHIGNTNNLSEAAENKSNGISIGPEFSRICAEMVLQQLDRLTETELECKYGLYHNADYRFFRYVDDSFIFAKDESSLHNVIDVYKWILNENGLTLKESKTELFSERPFLSPATEGKERLMRLVENMFENRLMSFQGYLNYQERKYEFPTLIDAAEFISQLRIIISSMRGNSKNDCTKIDNQSVTPEAGPYKDISAWLLHCIHCRLDAFLLTFNTIFRQYAEGMSNYTNSEEGIRYYHRLKDDFVKFSISVIKVLFFIEANDVRMATSINVVAVVNDLQRFVRGKYIFRDELKSAKFPSDSISAIDEAITQQTARLFRHKTPSDFGLMELLLLLDLQRPMFARNRISQYILINLLRRALAACSKKQSPLNFFTVFQLLTFANGNERYAELIKVLKPWLQKQIENTISTGGGETEALFTTLELLCNPRLVPDEDLFTKTQKEFDWKPVKEFVGKKEAIFNDYVHFDLHRAISHRKSSEVY